MWLTQYWAPAGDMQRAQQVLPGWTSLTQNLASFLLWHFPFLFYWLVSTFRLNILVSLFGQVMVKELQYNKDKHFNNLKRKLKLYLKKMNLIKQCYCFNAYYHQMFPVVKKDILYFSSCLYFSNESFVCIFVVCWTEGYN